MQVADLTALHAELVAALAVCDPEHEFYALHQQHLRQCRAERTRLLDSLGQGVVDIAPAPTNIAFTFRRPA